MRLRLWVSLCSVGHPTSSASLVLDLLHDYGPSWWWGLSAEPMTVTGSCFPSLGLVVLSPCWRGLCLSCGHPQPSICLSLWSSHSLAATLTVLTFLSPKPSMVELGPQAVQFLTHTLLPSPPPQDTSLASYWPSHPAEDHGQHAKAGHTLAGFSYSSCSTPLCHLNKETFFSPAFLKSSISELLSRLALIFESGSILFVVQTCSCWSMIQTHLMLHSHQSKDPAATGLGRMFPETCDKAPTHNYLGPIRKIPLATTSWGFNWQIASLHLCNETFWSAPLVGICCLPSC